MCTLMITVHLGSGLLKFRLKKITLITVKSTVTFFPLHEIMWPEQFGCAVILNICSILDLASGKFSVDYATSM